MGRKRVLFSLLMVLFVIQVLTAQQSEDRSNTQFSSNSENTGISASLDKNKSSEEDSASAPPAKQALVAYATKDYPVTPGDVYQLSFFRSLSPTVHSLMVENDMRINLGILGSVNAAGLTFDEAKEQIQEIVEASYSNSAPKIIIKSLGTFPVLVKGEVKEAGYENVNGLSRLSSVVKKLRTEYTSTRQVKIVGRNGDTSYYDLFQASRNGDMSQDPYVRPGDTVVLQRAKRQVSVQGQVYRSGSYQLLPGEQLTELVERYGDGLTPTALSTEIEIIRMGELPKSDTKTIYIDFSTNEEKSSLELHNGDQVVVPNKLQYRPVVYFEGALVSDSKANGSSSGSVSTGETTRYNRIKYTFEPGEKLSTALKAMQPNYRLESDLQGAFLVRSDYSETIAVDIESYLLRPQAKDPKLQHGDTIVIPFKQLFVVISGAVKKPGIYDYVQGRSYEYYVSLAGGVDKNQHWFGEHPKITDDEGNRLSDTAVIEPEYRIHYSHNNPFRVISPVAAVLSTTVSTILVIQNLIQ